MYKFKLNIYNPYLYGMVKLMQRTGQKVMVNPFTGNLVINHNNKFFELERETVTPTPPEPCPNIFTDDFNDGTFDSWWNTPPVGNVNETSGILECGHEVGYTPPPPMQYDHYIKSQSKITGDFRITVDYTDITWDAAGDEYYYYYLDYLGYRIYRYVYYTGTIPTYRHYIGFYGTDTLISGDVITSGKLRLERLTDPNDPTTIDLIAWYYDGSSWNYIDSTSVYGEGDDYMTLGAEYVMGAGYGGQVKWDNLSVMWDCDGLEPTDPDYWNW
jgi:hypothetical protein